MSAASGGNSEPKQGQRSQSARGFCPRSTMRVPQPDIIEHFGNADAVPQLPERCLSRKAGIVRCCLKVGAMILSGPQYMNLGMFSWVLTAIVPRSQYNLTKKIQSVDKLPWMLRLYTRGDDQKLLNQFQYVAKNISLATLENATKEALRLYPVIDTFAPDPEAKVAIWYGSNEPNMKKAMQKLKRAYPNAQDHPFVGYGHGDIIGHPDVMARDIIAFMKS